MPGVENNRAHVVVAGANSMTGRRLVPQLRREVGRVTALVREGTGADEGEVVADWMNNPAAVEAIGAADAVIVLTGVFGAPAWEAYERGTVDTVERVARAAGPKTRIVYVSSMGADPQSDNWYLKAKGMAEAALASAPDAVILRGQPIVAGRPEPTPFERMLLQRAPDMPVTVYGDGTQRVRPVNVRDVVAITLAAAQGRGAAGTYDFGGPDEHTVPELVRLANGRDIPVRLLAVDQAAGLPGPPMAVVDLLARMEPASGAMETAARFGVELTPLSAIWPLQP